ncbi:MAG: GTP-binding protein [Desulfobacterales bacterium]|nr:GTP-binding protein [Desulfobacterales bacterium]
MDTKEGPPGYDQAQSLRKNAIMPLAQFLQNYHEGRAIREGFTVAIVGRPNVGKSSLMNRLLLSERAIVTPYPGTTRDAIEDELVIQGMAINLWDTAGLHESADPVETIGMQKTFAEDVSIYQKIASKPIVLVLNKVDLTDECSDPNTIPDDWVETYRTSVSALTGQGIEALRETILNSARGEGCSHKAPEIIPNLRQKILIESCLHSAEAAAAGLENCDSPELVDIHIRQALDYADEILGIGVRTEIVDSIFSQFCIGK